MQNDENRINFKNVITLRQSFLCRGKLAETLLLSIWCLTSRSDENAVHLRENQRFTLLSS